jgi:cytochrome c
MMQHKVKSFQEISSIITRYEGRRERGAGPAPHIVLQGRVMYSKLFVLISFVGGLSASASAPAFASGLDLARTSNCMACHQIDQKRVGPPFQAVAQRFAGQEGAVDYLSQTIRQGGRGRWGAVPMPAQPQVSPADARQLAEWILSLADKPKLKP